MRIQDDQIVSKLRNSKCYSNVADVKDLLESVEVETDRKLLWAHDENDFYYVFHKGFINKITRQAIQFISGRSEIIYADDVYVVILVHSIAAQNDHIKSFFYRLRDELDQNGGGLKEPEGRTRQGFSQRLKSLFYLLRGEVEQDEGLLGRQLERASRRRGQILYQSGDDTLLFELPAGQLMFLDSKDLSLTPWIVRNGIWEPPIHKFISSQLSSGDCFIDIGANCGYFTVIASSLVGPTGTVAAVEPQPRLAHMIRRTIAINGFDHRATVVECGVGRVAAKADLHMNESRSGSASIDGIGLPIGEVTSQQIEVLPLPDVLARAETQLAQKLRPKLIKVDVEGLELDVWEGAKDYFRGLHDLVILLEFAPVRYRNRGQDPQEFLADVVKEGFSVNLLSESGEEVKTDKEHIAGLKMENGFVDLILRKG